MVDSLTNVNYKLKADYEMLENYLSVIADGLDSIRIEEKALLISNTDNRHNRQRMKQNLQVVRATVSRQKERIAELEAKLASNTGNVTHLKKIIEAMREQLEEKEKELDKLRVALEDSRRDIRELTSRFDEVAQQNSTLTETIDTQNEVIEQQNRKINTGYVKIATKGELQDLGILSKGSLFKKGKFDPSTVDVSTFTTVDVTANHSYTLSNKAKILTSHPKDSYTLNKENGEKVLRITNPAQFWSLSKILIIQND